jgi:hypothetical protein
MSDKIWTQTGRVVYDRKKHRFGYRDVYRIVSTVGYDLTEEEIDALIDLLEGFKAGILDDIPRKTRDLIEDLGRNTVARNSIFDLVNTAIVKVLEQMPQIGRIGLDDLYLAIQSGMALVMNLEPPKQIEFNLGDLALFDVTVQPVLTDGATQAFAGVSAVPLITYGD